MKIPLYLKSSMSVQNILGTFKADILQLHSRLPQLSFQEQLHQFNQLRTRALKSINKQSLQFQSQLDSLNSQKSQLQSRLTSLYQDQLNLEQIVSSKMDIQPFLTKVQNYYNQMQEIFQALDVLRQSEEFWSDCHDSSGPTMKIKCILQSKGRNMYGVNAVTTAVEISCGRELTAYPLTSSFFSFPNASRYEFRAKEVKMLEPKFCAFLDAFNVTAFTNQKFLKLDFCCESCRCGKYVPIEKQWGTEWEAKLKLTRKKFKEPPKIDNQGEVDENDFYIAGQDALIRGEIKLEYVQGAWADFIAAVHEISDTYEQTCNAIQNQNQEISNPITKESQIKKVILKYFSDCIYPTEKYFTNFKYLITEGLKLLNIQSIQIEMEKYNYDLQQLKPMPICQLYHSVFNMDKMLKQIVKLMRVFRVHEELKNNYSTLADTEMYVYNLAFLLQQMISTDTNQESNHSGQQKELFNQPDNIRKALFISKQNQKESDKISKLKNELGEVDKKIITLTEKKGQYEEEAKTICIEIERLEVEIQAAERERKPAQKDLE